MVSTRFADRANADLANIFPEYTVSKQPTTGSMTSMARRDLGEILPKYAAANMLFESTNGELTYDECLIKSAGIRSFLSRQLKKIPKFIAKSEVVDNFDPLYKAVGQEYSGRFGRLGRKISNKFGATKKHIEKFDKYLKKNIYEQGLVDKTKVRDVAKFGDAAQKKVLGQHAKASYRLKTTLAQMKSGHMKYDDALIGRLSGAEGKAQRDLNAVFKARAKTLQTTVNPVTTGGPNAINPVTGGAGGAGGAGEVLINGKSQAEGMVDLGKKYQRSLNAQQTLTTNAKAAFDASPTDKALKAAYNRELSNFNTMNKVTATARRRLSGDIATLKPKLDSAKKLAASTQNKADIEASKQLQTQLGELRKELTANTTGEGLHIPHSNLNAYKGALETHTNLYKNFTPTNLTPTNLAPAVDPAAVAEGPMTEYISDAWKGMSSLAKENPGKALLGGGAVLGGAYALSGDTPPPPSLASQVMPVGMGAMMGGQVARAFGQNQGMGMLAGAGLGYGSRNYFT